MATDTFRKIEQFLEDYCKHYLHRMEKVEMKPLYSILLNCREYFPNETPLFIKFIQVQFNVDCDSTTINRRDAVKLYERIIAQYKLKEGDFRVNESKLRKERSVRVEEDLKDEEYDDD
jgi:hypothetical protein